MLLARRGLKVLVVDRATFPSDTLSTHQVQLPGVARLARWGVLDAVLAAGTPLTRDVRFDQGDAVIAGRYPAYQGVEAMCSPRRTLLDRGAGRSGSAAPPTCPATCASLTVPAGPWSVTPAEMALFRALSRRQEDADMFLGVLAGSVPLRQFMSPHTMVRLVGVGEFARLTFGQGRPQRPGPHVPARPGRLEKTAGRAPAD